MKTTLFLALLLLSLNSEGASAGRSAEDIAAKKAKKNAYNKAWCKANRERRNAQQKGYRDAAKLKSALSWHVGDKPLFEVEPLGDKDKVEPVDLASFAFGAGGRKRARSDGAKGGPATKK